MNTTTRYVIAGASAVAIFATSFLITRAVNDKPVTPVDAAIEIPATETATVSVLAPVTVGNDAMDAAADLSPEVGTAPVTFAAGESQAAPSPEPNPTDEAAPPSEVLAQAAALDSAAGEVTDVLPTPTESAAPEPSREPESAPASDPCAETPGTETCPEGYAMTLYSLDIDPGIEVHAMADPFTAPDQGSNLWCPPADLPEGALQLAAIATEAGTVRISYWPADRPSSIRDTELTQVQEYVERSTRHCGATEPLEEGAYQGIVEMSTDGGRVSEPREFSFDSRGRPTIPKLKVVPLGTNWVWVGVMHTRYETALVNGYPTSADAPVTCGADVAATPLRQDIASHTSDVTSEALIRHHYNAAFTRSTSALLYLPPGTTAVVCGITFNEQDPSWDSSAPERVQSATVESPDAWEAAITVRGLSTYRPGEVTIRALGQTGTLCGRPAYVVVGGEASDTATTTDVNQTLCRIAGQNIQLDVSTWYRSDAGSGEQGTSRTRYLIAGDGCAGDCPRPEPRSFTVFLPGMGQDECPDSADGDCELRRRTAGARAVIDVTWQRWSEGITPSWTVSGVDDSEVPDPSSDAPQFDTDQYFTGELLGSTFQSAVATGTLQFDRVVDYTARAIGDCFTGGATASTASGRTTLAGEGLSRASVRLGNLCPGTEYRVAVTYTDADGNSGVAAPPGTPGVAPTVEWYAGTFTTPQKYLRVKAAIDFTTVSSFNASYLIRDSWLYLDGDGFVPSFGTPMDRRCFPASTHSVSSESGVIVVPLRDSYTLTQDLIVFSDVFYHPRSAECMWRASERWQDASAQTVSLADLTRGITVAGQLEHAVFPTNPQPFSYAVKFTATIQDSPEDA